jgi:5-methyltetrahydrofolate--homocysteine methyltransferase
VEPDLATLHGYIDWQFFFHAWELKGKFPAILERPEARELYHDATRLLDAIVRDGTLQARGVYGFWPARADGDDVALDEGTRFCFLRQQSAYGDSRPNRSLADLVAPAGDHLGAFAVSIHGADELAARFEAEHDDYHAIMVKALADRLAEAFAEWLHEQARREWYDTGERLSSEELIAERYRGIRPAFGYPACPDHTEKRKLFDLLGAGAAGLGLTETYAMTPGAAVAGVYFAHRAARYFSVGRIGRDQVADYAARKGWDVAEVERWLGPNLAYSPDVLTPA